MPTLFEKQKKAPINVRCEKCGLLYLRNHPDNERTHRRHHWQWATIAEPKPNNAIKKLNVINNLVAVDHLSPSWLKKAIYKRAKLLTREMNYDCIPWDESFPKNDSQKGFLFISNDSRIIGASVFEWQEADPFHGWMMMWVWLAPAYRRHGVLTQHWETFTDKLGPFYLQTPYSEAMAAFILKRVNPNVPQNNALSIAAQQAAYYYNQSSDE